MAITGCVVAFVLIAIYASVWCMMVSVHKDDFAIGYYYSNGESAVYFLDQEAADVVSTWQSEGDRRKWESVFAHSDRERSNAPFWSPMERAHLLLSGLRTVVPSHYIDSRDELRQRGDRFQQKRSGGP